MRLTAFLTACLSVFALSAAEPVRIIFDTDMCGDYDDVGALAVLNAMADAGECEILGVVSSTRQSPALGMSEVIDNYYGRTNLPMGVCKDLGPVASEFKSGVFDIFVDMVSARAKDLRYPSTEDAPDANEVYRRALADSPDGSVTLCTVGFLTNVRRLLETEGDAISPLTGKELVAKKVKAWYAMGGILPNGQECNLRYDAESSVKAISDSPVPVYFVDFNLGADVLTGLRVARKGQKEGPVAEAFVRCLKAWNEEGRGRPSWDELTVLAAVRGFDHYFDLERGTMTVDASTGSNTWTKASSGAHYVLVEKTPKQELRNVIDELMSRAPGKKRLGKGPEPYVWWHWCGTAVSKDGIVRDLDAMKDCGIGGATIFQVARGPCSEVAAFGYEDDTMTDFDFASEKWWEYVSFAAAEAKRRGIEIGMHNCPGYTVSGGPWITPENAMKKLVWTVAKKGETPAQPETRLGFYREIGTVEKGDKVYRFGYTCTGSQCMPVPMSMYGKCLEADKMSAKAVNLHLDHILARDIGLDFILMDSYEAGDYDWTDDFREEFTKRRGYDPLELLPAYVGEDAANEAKIKADMSRTVGELSTERHYWVFRDRIHAKGMKFFVEPYGGPFDKCEAAYASDQPTTEFWGARPFWVAPGVIGGNPQMGGSAGRAAARTIIAAEAYTAMPFQDPYVLSPRDFKACTDASFARGINRMFLHHWVHQPFPACRKPGMNMGYWGSHFGENATWYEPAKEFIAYLSRCQSLLQQGQESIDVLAVEDFREITDGVDIVPRRVFLNNVDFSGGYAIVKHDDGTPNGRGYRYLAVSRALLGDPAIAAKAEAAGKAGVIVLSEESKMPKRPFSVVEGVKVDENGPILGTTRRVLTDSGLGTIFFVANVSTNTVSFKADLRSGGRPELWYPGTDERETLPGVVARRDGYVRLPLTLGPQESVFISFGVPLPKAKSERHRAVRNLPLDGKCSLSFEKGRGAPEGELQLGHLYSWTESTDPNIAFFSGTATYRTRFNLSSKDARNLYKIALGDVRDIARVRLNGKDLGVAWYEPFEVLVGDAAVSGENVLEVEVTNGWHNRLLFEHSLPGDDCVWGPDRFHQCDMDGSKGACGRGLKRIPDWAWNTEGVRPATNRIAFTSWDFFNGSEMPRVSGLLGPVTLRLGDQN